MATLQLKDAAARGKYGLVVVNNPDDTFNREFKITGKEYAALALEGAGAPAGVSDEEWESGLAVAYGKDFDVGDAEEQADGTLLIKYAEKIVDGRFIESFAVFESDEWSGKIEQVTVKASIIDELDELESLTNGVLEVV